MYSATTPYISMAGARSLNPDAPPGAKHPCSLKSLFWILVDINIDCLDDLCCSQEPPTPHRPMSSDRMPCYSATRHCLYLSLLRRGHTHDRVTVQCHCFARHNFSPCHLWPPPCLCVPIATTGQHQLTPQSPVGIVPLNKISALSIAVSPRYNVMESLQSTSVSSSIFPSSMMVIASTSPPLPSSATGQCWEGMGLYVLIWRGLLYALRILFRNTTPFVPIYSSWF